MYWSGSHVAGTVINHFKLVDLGFSYFFASGYFALLSCEISCLLLQHHQLNLNTNKKGNLCLRFAVLCLQALPILQIFLMQILAILLG